MLSLFLPWWTFVSGHMGIHGYASFPWSATVSVFQETESIWGQYVIPYNQIPYIFFVSSSIVLAGLCGLTDKSRTRTIGGLLGIVGVISYFVLVFPKSIGAFYRPPWKANPYFGIFYGSYILRTGETFYYTDIWFLSVGFYLALAGSLMLLFPLFRTLIERLGKRL
ncbi:hypothetical protein GWO13_03075 [Candidatus Bathyarchaeota archaeon]|nr:hypothetical protein [Candidatus Bathyarchaeota archaeon]